MSRSSELLMRIKLEPRMYRCSLMRNMIILRVKDDVRVRLSRIRVVGLRIKTKVRYRLRVSREREQFRALKGVRRIRIILKV